VSIDHAYGGPSANPSGRYLAVLRDPGLQLPALERPSPDVRCR
jgi:hypothetical protein